MAGISYFGANLKHTAHLLVSKNTRLESAAINTNDTSKT